MQKKLAILGFRGVGKSTVAKLLSKMTKIPLYVMDREIEAGAGMSILQIVKENDWNYFRDLELDQLRSQAKKTTVILDCGGGILEGHEAQYSPEKADLLIKNFYCIYLSLADEKLLSRLQKAGKKQQRPSLPGDIEKILLKRKPWFEKVAHYTINTDGLTAKTTAEKIAKKIANL